MRPHPARELFSRAAWPSSFLSSVSQPAFMKSWKGGYRPTAPCQGKSLEQFQNPGKLIACAHMSDL
ncbi:uncharacterized protein PgNI_11523 [Pyricularia grisea]|uniref:Uncharacterized protein n=1 Tax=Pyricularia grisea TaxID=148305 RepID=A0A6P8ANC3_PYRGI|nr:uncharacterized protein PgNI_11523 [Pyricularia grisea]TLD03542.1 hypothetical protein PgNI_11523 [Pyricularia grisea]